MCTTLPARFQKWMCGACYNVLVFPAGDSVEQVVQVTDSVFLQLSSYSLEELGIEKPENVSWKDPDGFHFQALAYTLLGVYDLVCSHFAESLADPELTTTAAGYITHVIDCHRRLQEWLSAASRTKRLKGMLPLSEHVHDAC